MKMIKTEKLNKKHLLNLQNKNLILSFLWDMPPIQNEKNESNYKQDKQIMLIHLTPIKNF